MRRSFSADWLGAVLARSREAIQCYQPTAYLSIRKFLDAFSALKENVQKTTILPVFMIFFQ